MFSRLPLALSAALILTPALSYADAKHKQWIPLKSMPSSAQSSSQNKPKKLTDGCIKNGATSEKCKSEHQGSRNKQTQKMMKPKNNQLRSTSKADGRSFEKIKIDYIKQDEDHSE